MVDDEEVCGGGGEEVTFLQWNILSQTLGIHGDFQACPPEALLWDHRWPLLEQVLGNLIVLVRLALALVLVHSLIVSLTQEILCHQPDIICLEEVDCFEVLSSRLATEGYQGFWVPKPNSPCLKFKVNPILLLVLHVQDNMGPDGNAVFFRKTKFHHQSNRHHVLDKSNSTLLVCELELKASGRKITIYVTHLKASKGFESVRAAQAKHLIEIIKSDGSAAAILAGDFNAGLTEPVYDMVRSLGLESAYKEVLGAEPAYTTWKVRVTLR